MLSQGIRQRFDQKFPSKEEKNPLGESAALAPLPSFSDLEGVCEKERKSDVQR